jgi:hypothetical protein
VPYVPSRPVPGSPPPAALFPPPCGGSIRSARGRTTGREPARAIGRLRLADRRSSLKNSPHGHRKSAKKNPAFSAPWRCRGCFLATTPLPLRLTDGRGGVKVLVAFLREEGRARAMGMEGAVVLGFSSRSRPPRWRCALPSAVWESGALDTVEPAGGGDRGAGAWIGCVVADAGKVKVGAVARAEGSE